MIYRTRISKDIQLKILIFKINELSSGKKNKDFEPFSRNFTQIVILYSK